MSEGSVHGVLAMPCLGRPFQLGTLYDCRNDSLIPGVTLWGPDTLGTPISKPMEGSDFEIITEDSLNEKTQHLDVSAGLKFSVLGGLVKAGGSGQFLYDRTTSKRQARVSLRYKSTSRFEQLNMSHLGKVEYPRFLEDDIATHVVTGVQYGADAFFVFDRQIESSEKFRQIHGKMEAMIKVLPSIDLEVGGSADLDIQNKGKEGMEKIQCKFYGDFILPKNPTTYQDAVRVYQELPKLLGGAGYPNSVPKKVWLYPLSKLDSRVQRMVRDISSHLIDDLQEIMESLHELEVQINDLVRSEVCASFEDIKSDLKKLKRLISGYKQTIMKNLSTLLPKVRGGGEEETKLAELLEMNSKSPFNCEHVLFWMREKEREISILAVYLEELQKHKIQLAFQSDKMVRLTSGLAADSVLCFDFNIPAGNDAQLQKMENYLHSRKVDQELQLQSPWYKSQELRQQLQRFVSFVTRNCPDSTCKYVVTNGHSGSVSNKLGVMVVFEDASPTEFEPPDQPGVPCALSKIHNCLQLSWKKPKYGSDSVQSYTVSYHSVDDPPDQWSTQTSSEECLVLTKLTPGSLYHFKVIAESAVGSGPESKIGEERLPPDQPGKPENTTKTCNSLHLKWAKPTHGASIVGSYTVHYRSVNDPPEQWSTQICNEECVMLTKLTPGSLYHFKVTAESAVGSSPESKVGEERLPPDQPGKPQVTEKSHNSVQLKWEKPKHGAHIVQSYSIFYRSENQTDNWRSQQTNKQNISLSGLTSGALYCCKVTAQSLAGSSPASEESEVRLPPDQPGKPYSLSVTHNSLKIKWTEPKHGARIVSSYTVSYRSVDDHASSKWFKKSITEECLVLTKLTPGSLYHFKVTAESAAGSSPASEICEARLPPDQPGKPNVYFVTCNSVQLKWTPPQHGAETVLYYTISYLQSLDTLCQSLKTTSKHECVTLSKLAPATVYTFKVRAESAAGPGPESELSDFIITMTSSLGKPRISNVTHNSVQLSWEKQSECVQVYTVLYCSVKDPAGQWHGQVFSNGNCSVHLDGLLPSTTYVFKVKGETNIGKGASPESELSDPVKTLQLLSPRPGRPYATNVDYESFQINWEKPNYDRILYYSISCHSDDNPKNKWDTLVTKDNNNKHKFTADPEKKYFFKVSAVTNAGYSSESEVSGPIVTRPKTWGARLLSSCKLISTANPCVYQLPLYYTMNENDIIKAVVGSNPSIHSKWSLPVPHKVLMVVGATGAGKTTLINGMANYILGVKWEDQYRFKLISEKTDQTKSQTKCITAYTFYKDRGSPLPYTLTVIDTPGFGDTGGLERDKQIKQIKDFFSVRGDEGIDQLHGIGFVTQAPLARLTPTQRYMFDSILSVFSKDVADNIFLMVTFADGQQPPVLDVVKDAVVPFKNYFKFNNSALFASNLLNDECDKMFWKKGIQFIQDFLSHFSQAGTQGLESEVSDTIATRPKPLGIRLLSMHSCKCISKGNPSVYQLPLQYTTMKKIGFIKATVGSSPPVRSKLSVSVPHKVLILVGAPGAENSTLINGMANYIMGVDWEDVFRFKIISEKTDDWRSEIECITAYTFHKDEGSPLPYTLTVIDTQGLEDNDYGWRMRDNCKQIVRQIKEFLTLRDDDGIDRLHGIGFVTQAFLTRLTSTQQYVLDSILSVFGKDVADKIFLMVTFADGKRPPVLDAVKDAGVPFKNYFKFNNSALFANNLSNDECDKMFWKIGKQFIQDFLSHFSQAGTQGLESEVSDTIATRPKPLGIRLLSMHSCKCISKGNPSVYQLPLQYTLKKSGIIKATVGSDTNFRQLFMHYTKKKGEKLPVSSLLEAHKVLMLVGVTGAGKNTLINGMANYIVGVDWEDEYRFKLISEETAHDQTTSQTKCITAYTFHKDHSFLPYTLTVINIPGFGGTGGLERDRQLVRQIKQFFIQGDELGIDQLHGIGFVTQAPQAQLTPTQRYVFDSILSVFGKDVADNIFLMVTFADGKRPPVLDAIKATCVSFKSHFKFNNSALFASKTTSDEFDRIFWRMGKNSFEDFFDYFSKIKAQSLQQSREVLQMREQLEVTIQGLQRQMHVDLAMPAGNSQVEAVISKLKIKIEEKDQAVLRKIDQAKQTLRRLKEIALSPGHLTVVEYIDTLIESEKQDAHPGWNHRVTALYEVKKQSEILTYIQSRDCLVFSHHEEHKQDIGHQCSSEPHTFSSFGQMPADSQPATSAHEIAYRRFLSKN